MRLLLTTLFCLLPLCAQQEGQQKKKGPPPGPPTNLKVLKTTSGVEVRQIMRTFTAGLGVQCNYCHVQGNFASDENPKKETARHMIQMTEQINSHFPDGKMHVTCYTCHRGEEEPKTAPEPKPAF
ncbi:MAG TPA: c-type cytochrome [Bryobacteraceae bacterium]|jgi:Photosynthetic reaction centre cytochrome C subunit|nr:c-type cytochrome [Bryobacteraceae bacterium]